MTLNTLILELGDCTMSILPKTDLKHEFAQIQLYNPQNPLLSEEIIYFAKWTDFNNIETLPAITIVLYDDRGKRNEDDLEYLSNFSGGIVFENEKEYQACFACFENCFLRTFHMNNRLQEIQRTVYENGNLQDLVNKIADFFAHPVNLVDNAFGVLAVSDNYELFSTDLARDKQSGFISTDVVKRLNLAATMRRNLHNRTVIIDHINGEFKNYVTTVAFHDILLGYFSVFVPPEEPLSALLKSYLEPIAILLGIYMQRSDLHLNSRSTYYTTLLSSLLSESATQHEINLDRFEAFDFKIRKYKYIIVVDMDPKSNRSYLQNDFADTFKRILGNCIYTVQQNQIIYLTSYEDINEVTEEIHEKIDNQLLDMQAIHIGFSSAFAELTQAHNYLLEARAAIETGILYRPKDSIYFYDDYRLLHMIQKIMEYTDMRMFMLPQLYDLREHDRAHNTQLLHTLYTHLQQCGNVPVICEQLHIHRNTYYFRIKKIVDMTGINLNNADQITMMQITFRMMQIRGEL